MYAQNNLFFRPVFLLRVYTIRVLWKIKFYNSGSEHYIYYGVHACNRMVKEPYIFMVFIQPKLIFLWLFSTCMDILQDHACLCYCQVFILQSVTSDPWLEATKLGYLDIVKVFIQHNVDVNIKDKVLWLLNFSCIMNNMQMIYRSSQCCRYW